MRPMLNGLALNELTALLAQETVRQLKCAGASAAAMASKLRMAAK